MNTISMLNARSRIRRQTHQRGFIQAVLLFGIALMTAILGGFALANRSPTAETSTEEAKVNASVVLKQGSDLRDGVARFANDYGASVVTATMDFSTTADQGLFDTTARYASPQVMPSSAFATAQTIVAATASTTPYKAGHWYLNKATPANALSTTAADPMVVLPDLRLDVCRRINNMLYGSAMTATPPASTGALADWASTTAPADGEIGATNAVAGVLGWPEGCVSTSDSKYVYFKVVQEN